MANFVPYHSNLKRIWYSYAKILSYNLEINVVIGDRGCGKTYGAMKLAYSDFKFNNRKFAILRDNDTAVDTLCENNGDNLFSAIRKDEKFKDDKFMLEKNLVRINGKNAGYIMSASTFYKNKGSDYADVFNIIYDEFIPEKSQVRIGDDIWKFINAVQTISRTRKCRLFLLANALDRGNGVLELLGFDNIKEYGFYINKEKHAILHYVEPNENYTKLKKNSLTGWLVSGTKYEENMIDNKFSDDNDFIFDKLPPRDIIGVYHNRNGISIRISEAKEGQRYFATKDINPNTLLYMRYTFDVNMVNSKVKMAPKEYKKFLVDIYANHMLYFESKYIKNEFLELIK